MSIGSIIFLVIIVALVILLFYALKKKWIAPSSGGIFTSQVAMHDLVPKDKQKAMEYIIEDQEDRHRRKEDSGEGPEGGKPLNEP